MAHAKRHTGSILLRSFVSREFARISAQRVELIAYLSDDREDVVAGALTRSRSNAILTDEMRTFLQAQSSQRCESVLLSRRVQLSCYHKTGQLTESRADPQLSGARAR